MNEKKKERCIDRGRRNVERTKTSRNRGSAWWPADDGPTLGRVKSDALMITVPQGPNGPYRSLLCVATRNYCK